MRATSLAFVNRNNLARAQITWLYGWAVAVGTHHGPGSSEKNPTKNCGKTSRNGVEKSLVLPSLLASSITLLELNAPAGRSGRYDSHSLLYPYWILETPTEESGCAVRDRNLSLVNCDQE